MIKNIHLSTVIRPILMIEIKECLLLLELCYAEEHYALFQFYLLKAIYSLGWLTRPLKDYAGFLHYVAE